MDRTAAIRDFWAFWKKENRAIAASFSTGMSEAHIEAMNRRVRAIDKSLDWEFGPGSKAQHHLCLSGKGDPVLRAVAERWCAAAPKPSKLWEFHPARQPHRANDLRLTIDDQEIALAELTTVVTVDDDRELLHVGVHHPKLRKIADETLRRRIVFIGLETLLGEDDVERWIGDVDVLAQPKAPKTALPLAALSKAVAKLAKRATGDSWAILKGERKGKPIVVLVNRALKRIDHLALDHHLTVAIRLADRTRGDGLTTNEESDVLGAMRDDLEARLGDAALAVASETFDGRRTLHLRVAWTPAIAKKVEAWRKRARGHDIRVKAKLDPRWDDVIDW